MCNFICEVESMAVERKTLTQLSVPICLETLFYMLSGMVDTLMLSSVGDQAVGAVGKMCIRDRNKTKKPDCSSFLFV